MSPLRTEVEIFPGESIKGTLRIVNATDSSSTVHLDAEGFRVIDPSYNYEFDKKSDVISWVKFKEPTVDLKARESKQVPYTITVPLGAKAGGRYISMFASSDLGNSDGVVKARQRVGSLFYLTVIGDIARGGTLVSLRLPGLVGGDSKWSMRIQNSDTTHFRTNYSLAIHSSVNGKLIHKSTGEALSMPGTTREIEELLRVPNMPGIYKAVITVGLGDNPTRQETRVFVYIPVWLWGAIAAAATVIIATIIIRQNRNK